MKMLIVSNRCPKWVRGARRCNIKAQVDIKIVVDVQMDEQGVLHVTSTPGNVYRSVEDTVTQPEFYKDFEWHKLRCETHGWESEQ